ncbi:MAG: SET domain-containing protein-lysine N-methyltransferase [Gemmatimonadaceae bacterium]|nr:SET domain-containing protein-lysine N-methyltransferase [Gemmatimonadaceae bacterium]
MKVCVLQPDYSTSNVDYKNYDPPRDLARLLPDDTVDHVALNKLTTYRQLRDLSTQGYDVFVNLCEGYLEWDVPSIDVVDTLERLNLPFTGPVSKLYHVPKPLMKYVAYTAGVTTPRHALVRHAPEAHGLTSGLRYPLFVKPSHAGDSLGIDERSLVRDPADLEPQVARILADYPEVLIEEFIEGREFTVLVLGAIEEKGDPVALTPVEFVFPADTHFKTYAFKTSELHPDANVPVRDGDLAARLKDAAIKVFRAFGGMGYARMDFRCDAGGTIHFLEVNFTCSVFYQDGYEGSADYVLAHDGMGQAGFAQHIIAEAIARHRRAQPPYAMQGNAISGYGIFATRDLEPGDLVFRGEERAQRVVTARHVDRTWHADDRSMLRRYGYPLGNDLFVLWDDDPTQWAPTNHSCEPNAAFDGLNVVAMRRVRRGEEITLDYGAFLDEASEPFRCTCGAVSCRGLVKGSRGTSVAAPPRPARKRRSARTPVGVSRSPD